ncbi:MAG: hypothetical protein H6733_06790 [Alphaproteobacteria bacterium]|nr:hypothetical protein [Alphaproteobacteria bacterium]
MDDRPADFRRYTRRLLLTAALGMLVLGGFLMIMDPYGIWRRLGVPHAPRPPLTWSRIAAAERLDDDCDVALVGSSRVVFGFGVRLPRWNGRKLCNGALGGTSMTEIDAEMDFMADETKIGAVLLFLDLHMFHDGRGTNHDFAQSRLNPDRTALTYYLWSLTSLDAFEYSTKLAGLWLPFFEQPKPMRSSSMETRGMLKSTMLRANMYRVFEGPEQSEARLVHLLDVAEAHHIKIITVIPAVHAMQLEALGDAGLWEVNKDWRRFLTAEMARRGIPLWDFATYHSPARSTLPTTPVEKPNPWWSDMSHQSQLLGKATLERIRDGMVGKEGDWEPGFGVLLTPDTIEAHLAELDEGRARWQEEHPDQLAWYKSVMDHITLIDPTVWDDYADNARRGAGELVPTDADGDRKREVDLGDDADLDF